MIFFSVKTRSITAVESPSNIEGLKRQFFDIFLYLEVLQKAFCMKRVCWTPSLYYKLFNHRNKSKNFYFWNTYTVEISPIKVPLKALFKTCRPIFFSNCKRCSMWKTAYRLLIIEDQQGTISIKRKWRRPNLFGSSEEEIHNIEALRALPNAKDL